MTSTIQFLLSDGHKHARDALNKAKAVICDIDGVLLSAGKAVRGAKELLGQHRCVFVSNNSTHTAASLAGVFNCLGLSCVPEDFFLAGEFAINWIHDTYPQHKVLVLASGDVARKADHDLNVFKRNCVTSADRPEIVLLCRDQSFTFDKLELASNAIKLGAQVVLSNPDLTHPAENGLFHTETGALWQAICAQVRPRSPLKIIGKPRPELVLQAIEFLDLVPSDLVFLGDNLATDAPAANAAGVPFIHTGGEGFALHQLVTSNG